MKIPLIPFYFILLLSVLTMACRHESSVSHEGNSPMMIDETKLKKGDIIQPFMYLNEDEHDFKVEIRFSGDDMLDIHHRRMTSRKFWTDEPEVFEKIKQWKFIYGQKNKMKASSTFRIYRDNEQVEQHGIIVEKNWLGFQSKKYGYLVPVDKEEMFRTIEAMNHY